MSDFEYDYLSSLAKRNAILLCPSGARREYLRLLAKTYQVIIVAEATDNETNNILKDGAHFDPKEAINPISKPSIDLLLIDFTSNLELNKQELSRISSYLIEYQIEAVVWAGLDDLDEVYASLPVSQCHFLVGSDPLEAMPALTGLTGQDVMSHLSDISQDESNEKEYAALHRISGELASLAKTLAAIAVIDDMNISDTQKTVEKNDAMTSYSDHEDFMNHSVFKDKPTSFAPFPKTSDALNVGNYDPKPTASPFINNGNKYPATDSVVNADMVRAIIKQRRMRDNFFESELFADPAWDILLDLMAARLSGQTVSVSSLCIAAAVPATTALRWITSMTKNGMLERKSDPMDARRVFMDLSDETFAKLEAYLTKTLESRAPTI